MQIYKIKIHNLFKITNLSLLFRSFINVKRNFKLQTKVQIAQQHNKFKLEKTYRIKELIVKDKM